LKRATACSGAVSPRRCSPQRTASSTRPVERVPVSVPPRKQELPKPEVQAALVALRAEVVDILADKERERDSNTANPPDFSAAVALGAAAVPNFGRQQMETPSVEQELPADSHYHEIGGLPTQPPLIEKVSFGHSSAVTSFCWPPSMAPFSMPASSTRVPIPPIDFAEARAQAAAAVAAVSRVASPRLTPVESMSSMASIEGIGGATDAVAAPEFVCDHSDVSFRADPEVVQSLVWNPPDSRRVSVVDSELSSDETAPPWQSHDLERRFADAASSTAVAASGQRRAVTQVYANQLESIKMRCHELMQVQAQETKTFSPSKRTSRGGA